MAYDLAENIATGDLLLQNNDLMIIDNAERVAQQILITLRFWYGEWFLDTTQGVPYLEYILVKNPNINHIRQILTEAILSVEGVQKIDEMTLDFDQQNRRLYVEYTAATNYGLLTRREVLEGKTRPTRKESAKTTVIIPAQIGILTYDGAEQSPSLDENYDSSIMTLAGTMSAIDAGNYAMTVSLINPDLYKWQDGTSTPKTINWYISRAIAMVPVQSGVLIYDGTVQSPTWINYDSDKMTLSGDSDGINAGTYTSIFTLSDDYQWPDGMASPRSVSWEIERASILAVPSQSGSITYDGTSKSPTWSDYNTSQLTLSGDTSETDAGQYTAIFTPKTNYQWFDGTTAGKDVVWEISRAVISSVPSQSGTLTYDGTEQTPSWSGYDSTKMDISGTTAGTNAGSYTATFTPKSNYQWSDNTTTPKNVSWTIGKAAGSLSLSANSMSLDTDTTSGTVTITRLGDGAISAVSSNTSIATAAVSGTTLTITGVDTGSATVTVSVAEGTNYLAPTDATVSVSVAFAPPATNVLNDNSWATISTVAQAGEGDLYWDVGDVKMITLNGKIGDYLTLSNQSLGVFILGFNHKDNNVAENNIMFGGFKTALSGGVDVALVDSVYGSSFQGGQKCFNMNHKGNKTYYNSNFGGWKGSDLRYDILGATSTQPSQYNQIKNTSNVGYDATSSTLTNPVADTLLAALPSDLRSVIRLRTHYVDNTGNSSNVDANVTAVTDAVSLLAESEIFSTRSIANQYEQNHNTRMAYYIAGNSVIKKKYTDDSAAVFWWECSPRYDDAIFFGAVYYTGTEGSNRAYYSRGVAPAFKV